MSTRLSHVVLSPPATDNVDDFSLAIFSKALFCNQSLNRIASKLCDEIWCRRRGSEVPNQLLLCCPHYTVSDVTSSYALCLGR